MRFRALNCTIIAHTALSPLQHQQHPLHDYLQASLLPTSNQMETVCATVACPSACRQYASIKHGAEGQRVSHPRLLLIEL